MAGNIFPPKLHMCQSAIRSCVRKLLSLHGCCTIKSRHCTIVVCTFIESQYYTITVNQNQRDTKASCTLACRFIYSSYQACKMQIAIKYAKILTYHVKYVLSVAHTSLTLQSMADRSHLFDKLVHHKWWTDTNEVIHRESARLCCSSYPNIRLTAFQLWSHIWDHSSHHFFMFGHISVSFGQKIKIDCVLETGDCDASI